jgi:hypothetical protein
MPLLTELEFTSIVPTKMPRLTALGCAHFFPESYSLLAFRREMWLTCSWRLYETKTDVRFVCVHFL